MFKLFITLVVGLLMVIIAYYFGVNQIVSVILSGPKEAYYQDLGKGSLSLLNKSVVGLDDSARQEKLAQLKTQFPYFLDMQPLEELGFNDYQRKRLNHGLIVSRSVENDEVTILHAKVPDTSLVWSFGLDISDAQDLKNTAKGTFYLIKQELLKHPDAARPAAMEAIQSKFGFTVALARVSDLSFTADQLKDLNSGELIAVYRESPEAHLYQKLPNSEYVFTVPPIDDPLVAKLIMPMAIFLFFALVSLVVLGWVWTLWRDLNSIKKAAESFGNGEYDTRVPYRKSARLASLSQAFNAMAEQTQNSIRSHKELTGAVSHELRTPVARMRFSLDMLESTQNMDDRQRYIGNMNKDMEELDSLLNELLTYARFDQAGQQAVVQTQALKPWLDSAMEGLQGLSGGIVLIWCYENIDERELADFDPVLVSRLLSNLVQNGIRHANTRVVVTLSKDDDVITLCVDDDGAGVPENDRQRLFEAFATQDSSRNKNSNGFGLGLAIVKRIVTAHQGTVVIDDSPLGGARLLVCWPSDLNSRREHEQ